MSIQQLREEFEFKPGHVQQVERYRHGRSLRAAVRVAGVTAQQTEEEHMLPPGETIDAWLSRNGFGKYAFAIKGCGYTELSFLADAGEELVEKLIGSLDMPEPVA